MSPEIQKVGMKADDAENNEVWNEIVRNFLENPGIVQQIRFIDGPCKEDGFLLSMYQTVDGSGYLQVEEVTNDALATRFMDWCLEHGEVLPVGIYRFPFSTLSDFSKNP